MSERLSIRNSDPAEWAIICTLAQLNSAVMQKIVDRKDGDFVEVCLTINGEETKFSTIIERLVQEAHRWSFEKARELVEERGGVLKEKLMKLEQLADEIESHFKREVTTIIPEALRDEDYR